MSYYLVNFMLVLADCRSIILQWLENKGQSSQSLGKNLHLLRVLHFGPVEAFPEWALLNGEWLLGYEHFVVV